MNEKNALPKGIEPPHHIAMILDGNRRWARAKGLQPWEGHKAGYQAVLKLSKAARNWGVHTFTVWAWSTENWQRSEKEVSEIMNLLRMAFKIHKREFHKDKVRFIHLGDKHNIPKDIAKELAELEDSTEEYKKYTFNLAFNYGGHDEIVRATKKIVQDKIPANKIDEKLFESYLDTKGQPYPYPDLFIRTSGEQRTSGLLPWQLAYAEFYFEPEHLPDFTPEKLKEAIIDFNRRRRRFGGNDSVEHFTFNPEVAAKLEIAWWRLSKIPQGTRLRDYALKHISEQFGLSKDLAKKGAKYLIQAIIDGDNKNWEKAVESAKDFYQLIKDELKLAFEPAIVARMQVNFWKDINGKDNNESALGAEESAKQLCAEVYRISLFQAAKVARLMVMANIEKNLAQNGLGEHHWAKAEIYLQQFYKALKEKVA